MATANETKEGASLSNPQIAVAILFGAVLALVGFLGPVLGGANGELIIFGRNYLHDAIHLLTGVAGVGAGYSGAKLAKTYNITLGVVYALVAVLGFVLFDLFANLIALNAADNYLHLLLAVVFLVVGVAFGD